MNDFTLKLMNKEVVKEYSPGYSLLNAVALSMDELISNSDVSSALTKCLRIICSESDIDNAGLFLSLRDKNGKTIFLKETDYFSDTGSLDLISPCPQYVNVEISDYLLRYFSEKQLFNSNNDVLPDDSAFRSLINCESILSSLILPVFHGKFIWGFLVFENQTKKRNWSDAEINVLQRFCLSISKAVERSSDQRLKERLSLIARRNRLGVHITGPDLGILYVNESFQKMTGFSKDELIGQNPYELLKGPLTQVKSIELLRNGHEISYPVDIDIILYRKDRSWFWANVKQQSLEDKTKGDQDFFSFIQDISEKKIAEEHIRNSRRRLTTLIQNLKAGILLEDENHRIVFANPSFCRMFNIQTDPSELGGMDSATVFREISNQFRNPGKFLDRCRQILSERKIVPEEEWKIIENRTYECDYVPLLKNDTVKGHLWKFTNITFRKNQEKILKQQEAKYRNIIANMKMGLLEIDTENTITYSNLQFSKMSGYTAGEITGKNISDLKIGEQFEKLLSSGAGESKRNSSGSSQIKVNTSNGKWKWWLTSFGPNYNDNGNLTGTVAICVDITEQKNIEQELEVARERAEESSRAKETFLATMSHEIRTPLNVILGMIRDISRESLSTTQDLFVKNASASGQHLLSIVNNILDITKIESGQIEIDFRPFRFSDVINEAVLIMTPSAQEKMLEIKVSISEEIESVYMGDSSRIRQILLNILENSVKFTEEGSISVNGAVSEIHNGKHRIIITIKDTGIGIDDAIRENIFNRFTQGDYSHSRKYGGTGMGLSISYELIKLMNGSLNISSKVNQGTAVEVLIELEKAREEVTKSSDSSHFYELLKGKRILLVDDSYLNRLVAINSLSYYGMIITEAENGIKAIELLNKSYFDLILMDLQMPELGGLETTRIIREEMGFKIPVIALTANVFRSELERCMSAGMNDYITKPFDEGALLAVLVKYLIQDENQKDRSNVLSGYSPEKSYDLGSIHALSRGNKEFVQKMVNIFCNETPLVINQIRKAWESNNYVEMKRLAHRLKPSLANFGIKSATDSVKAIEKYDETSQSASYLSEYIMRLDTVTENVIRQLESEKL